jgi:hypothetical protein
MKEVAHVLGNGPSRKNFVNDPQGDVYGCNLSDFALPLTASFIMDKVAIDHIHNNNIKLPWPIILPWALDRIASQCPYPPQVIDRLDTVLKNGESTGHYAVGYCIRRYKEVHLWGFDSMKKDSIESDSHEKIPEGPRSAKNYLSWRDNWERLWRTKAAQECKIVIHSPEQ